LQNNTHQEPKRKGHLARYRQIAMVLAKYKLEKVLNYVGMQNYRLIGWMFRGNPWRKMNYSEPERMRMAIEELGTSFVKLGQILSTRTDLLPPAYTTELAKLQSSMKPMPIDQMKKVISDELGRPTDEVFISFENPMALHRLGRFILADKSMHVRWRTEPR